MTMITKSALAALVVAMTSSVEAAKLKNVVYYMEWAIYGRKFGIFDLDWDKITHINYAFGKPSPDGTVGIIDAHASVKKRFSRRGDSWNDQGNNLYGNFGQGFKQKQKARGTKFGLSIGGWTLSDQFSSIASTETGRRTFAKSSVKLMLDLGLDFLDIDWEYPVEGGNDSPPVPHRPDDIKNYVLLLSAIRDEFKTLPWKAELSVASPAGPDNYRHWDFTAICGQLDFINIMTYDLAGSWSKYTDHQANLYEDPNHPPGAKYSTHNAVQDYIKGGCPSDKIVLGIPAYGRSFEGSNGLYSNFTKPTKGSWVAGNDGKGVWDYKVLPLPGATEIYDEKLGATYSYDPTSKIFTSYEGPKSLAQKLDYIKKYNLGGTMFWSGDADAKSGSPRSLITQVYNTFGRANMAFENNNLNYPTSQYANIRAGAVTTVDSVNSTASVTSSPVAPVTSTAPGAVTTVDSVNSTASVTSSPAAPVTSNTPEISAGAGDQCKGNKNVCYWPLTSQTVPFSQARCKLYVSLIWCP
ncbi:hypothetical protein H257_19261 [Aphanomyces astaci]|uniref:GH18 domain-containing protein n=1 Tax=Aphanomyces astaci TaxID=112090 RepID=W4F8J8_APHAT|nr:hypothetical protein H257_19261 [Aphanomyces astaci]ETV63805.1 hypothetical protein H257_19261 [Aphanomyces astaci]|eukprot:XP_009846711.1 hypothetical protein H257_19261 [Aphanomyces astaci]